MWCMDARGRFLGDLYVEVPIGGGKRWVVHEPIEYHLSPRLAGETGISRICVPEGFQTDFASVPRILWNIIPPTGRYTYAAVVHDYLYDGFNTSGGGVLRRKHADGVFLEAMLTLGVSPITAHIMWAGVRVGGWMPWMRVHGW